MSKAKPGLGIREAVGIYFDAKHLENAVRDLHANGFAHDEIGMLAGKFTVQEKLGHLYQEVNADLASPNAPDVAFVGREAVGDTVHAVIGSLFFAGAAVAGGAVVASAGILGGALSAAVATTGVFSGVAALLGKIIIQSDVEYLEEQVDTGHLLLFVRVRNPEQENKALQILGRDAAYNPAVYTVA
jgi:hypothetical protein